MKQLRLALPGAVVVKHHDASMIGLPDCSVTWQKKIAWLEFKLWVPPRRWDGGVIPIMALAQESPTQFEMMCKLANQSGFCAYLAWAKKSRRIAMMPLQSMIVSYVQTTPELVELVAACLRSL